ncbi:tRNA wybutosine-synthesizing protein 2 homolog isoform X1 [Canis lupus baileyi]|uniref:tRNA wybutosine-synthesizing protein 2 homolog n=1 Tax=Canis lupus dingo TaxID=286419 RepID=A0A8C0JYE1_CANLU|nr:tRNA wybutosine-synthesizing protein 2 homolog isoform X1 [Canis lupus familiaris]XP_025306293.1 tRNA wybutosine-synthesizing protein 2 homolog isoform X1 [Canis lupus dingo]XP_038411387.1 tRNA wybutosine-synthesizing protein 2 homolog isoform X1 [Canis lupus familiaris]XP_038540894.1 tRNA wybutosine-synthesizing protein 2 homolog isoform X1 [Canis lupus familiaris]XP_048948666.1 tRNA wybutosine-synthesizing protein 2 homolog isoform X1 [Canis lupus dingo]|eukprot:XP_005627979.1 tRNA wybutosine-synthesizing protein 2 homolog isoform X1 [Canis lupus familiaris]
MEGEAGKPAAVVAVVTEPRFTQRYREYLEKQQLLDRQHRLEKMPDGTVALPVLGEALPERHLQELRNRVAPGSTCRVTQLRDPVPSKKAQGGSPAQRLRLEVSRWVEGRGVTWSADLEADLPRSWQRHGNLLLLSEDCFQAKQWENLEPELWKTVASALGVHRVAKRGRVSPDGTRTPAVTLLLGDDGWVEHVDNGIRYKFDVTRCMFSFGNITEKLRVASLPCAGEVLVDLYAGIGYFTLPFLVHAGAAFVHACEWNPHAVVALRKNLDINGVAHRCQIHFGDNRKLKLSNIADRVNLGLIPSSEEGWPIACQLLRRDAGGILHIHQNVESYPGKTLQPPGSSEMEKEHSSYPQQIVTNQWTNGATRDSRRKMPSAATKPEWQRWAESAETCIATLLQQVHGKPWKTQILHIQPVKSYAPHVDHIVLDLECRPCALHG